MSRLAEYLGIARSLLVWSDNPLQSRRVARFYAQFVHADDLCFDIGAHLGSRVGPLVRLGARVVAVEPQPNLVRILQRWYAKSNVRIIAAAVGAKSGEQTLLVCQRHPTVSTLSPEWAAHVKRSPKWANVRWQQRITVPVTTLDHLIAEYGEPAFCKIDAEGYEYEILRGLSRPIRCLSFEYNPPAKEIALQALDRLTALGDYELNPSPGHDLKLVWPDWRNPAEVATWLRSLPADAMPGDIYARRLS